MACSSLKGERPEKHWANFVSPPQRDQVEEKLVRPWSGVICNIQCTSRKGVRDGPGGLEILDFFRVFNPENVQVMRGGNLCHHMGTAIIQFRNDLEGLKDAMAFEKYFSDRKHIREDWKESQGEGLGASLYGWLARGEDYRGATFSKYLQATGELVDLHDLAQEMEETHEQILEKCLTEKEKELQEMSAKLDEVTEAIQNEKHKAAIWKHDASASEEWHEQLNRTSTEMKTLQTNCQKHQEQSDKLQQFINERDSDVLKLHSRCIKLEEEVSEYKKKAENLNGQLEERLTVCRSFEIAFNTVREQLEDSKREVDKWMKNSERLVLLGKKSDKNRKSAELKAEQCFLDLQNSKRRLEKERYRTEAKECIVCMTEFGGDSDQQRSHYKDCHHANVCYGCASKLWKSKKRKCPSCNTPATERPSRLPAKIFL